MLAFFYEGNDNLSNGENEGGTFLYLDRKTFNWQDYCLVAVIPDSD